MICLRIFVSSPGDVGEERRLTALVIERLAFEWKDRVRLEPFFWEHEPLRASAGFQEQLPRPSDSDVVVCVLWSRLGTRLPPDLTRPDGSTYASGTEYEFEDALDAYRRKGVPDLLVYRKTSRPLTELDSEEAVLQRLDQKKALDAFIDRWFLHTEGYLTAAFHTFDRPARYEKLLEQHLRRLIEERWLREGGESAAPGALWDAGSPFRGLQAFEREHAAVFCGRRSEVSEVLDALRRQNALGKPFVLVLGMSGCGKSSLVRAGVLPELTFPNVIEGIGLWRVAILVPGRTGGDLLGGLAQALLGDVAMGELPQGGPTSGGTTAAELAELLRERPGAAVPLIRSGLTQVAQRVRGEEALPTEPAARLVLFVDQLEELFTSEHISTDDRQRFDRALSTLVRSGAVWAIATLRSDFYSRCSELEGLMSLKEGAGQYDLKPPSAASLGHMILQPARIAGLRFEDDPATGKCLDDLLLNAATRDPEALPLLEFTLDELYRRRQDDRLLTLAAYRDLGGVEGALAHRAEEVFLSLPPTARDALPAVLSGLVTLDLEEGSTPTRRSSPLADLTASQGASLLVGAFVEHRLLITDRASEGTPVVSIAHEALLHRWPRAQQWLSDNDELLRTVAHLKMAAMLWRQSDEDSRFLLPEGELLACGRSLLDEGRVPMSEAETALVHASETARTADRRRRHRRLAAGVAAAVALVAGISTYFYLFSFTHVRYYENFVRRHGKPQGVLAIDQEATGHRQWSLRFERRGLLGPVEKIEAVDADGRPTPMHTVSQHISGLRSAEIDETDLASRPCRWCFVYDGRGRVLRETARSCADDRRPSADGAGDSARKEEDRCPGGIVYDFVYKPVGNEGDKVVAEYVGEGLPTPQAESGAVQVRFIRTPDGLDRRIRYLDVDGRPAADSDGSYGEMVEQFTDDGRPLILINLGRGGFAAVHRTGFVRTTIAYDAHGRIQRVRFADQEGRPTLTRFGFASAELSYDEFGNRIRDEYLDQDGRPTPPYARVDSSYDRKGNLVRVALFDGEGERARHPWGWSAIALEYEERKERQVGRVVSLRLLGTTDEPVTVRFGFARIERLYDNGGNLVSESFLDEDGVPTERSDGVAQVTYVYGRGKLIGERYSDGERQPVVPIRLGYASVQKTYDARNRLLEEAYFDPYDAPTRDADGVMRRQWSYDGDGHRTSVSYLDGAGERMRSWRGEAGIRWRYDDDNRYTVEEYVDVDENPTPVYKVALNSDDAGFAAVPGGCVYRWTRERLGEVVELGCLDAEWQPVEILGCRRLAFDYDVLGRETERACLDGNGDLAAFGAGYGGYRTAYDDYGNVIGRSYFSSHDRKLPAPGDDGLAGIRWSYDHLGNQVEESYADESGQPTRHPDWHSRVEIAHDRWGRPVERRFLGPDRRPVRTANGYSRMSMVYGPRGEMLKLAYQDGEIVGRQDVAQTDFDYGPVGEVTEVRYFDAGENPVTRGLARVVLTYEPDGSRRDAVYDASGQKLWETTVHRFDEIPKPTSKPPRTVHPSQPTAARAQGSAVVQGSFDSSAPSRRRSGDPLSPAPPTVPADSSLADAIEQLAELTEAIQESYEAFLESEDREPEGREEEVAELLGELADAAHELRGAHRAVTGRSRGWGLVRNAFEKRLGKDQAAKLSQRAAETVRQGDRLKPLIATYPIGARAQGQWKEIQSLLARVRTEVP